MSHWNNKPLPPFNSHLGFVIEEWEDGRAVISVEVRPEFTNSQGLPHGGLICTLIDVAASLPGVYCPFPDRVRKALTLSLNTCFTGQAKSRTLKAVGKVSSAGFKIFHSSVEVFDLEGTLVATGQGVLRYRTGSETLEGEPIVAV